VSAMLATADVDTFRGGSPDGHRRPAKLRLRRPERRDPLGHSLTIHPVYANIGMDQRMKNLTWLADSRSNVKSFPAGVPDDIAEMELIRQRLKHLRSEVRNAEKRGPKQELSTGNVFADLGLADADEHLIKAGLVVRIDRTIRQRKLTQAAAARLMGIDQPKVSAMLAGQFRGYSVERLMRFLVALGHDVEIVVKPRSRGTAELRVA